MGQTIPNHGGEDRDRTHTAVPQGGKVMEIFGGPITYVHTLAMAQSSHS